LIIKPCRLEDCSSIKEGLMIPNKTNNIIIAKEIMKTAFFSLQFPLAYSKTIIRDQIITCIH